MRALLIHPPNSRLRRTYGVKKKVSFGHAPPLGIGYIAAYLERDGHEVQILDACAMGLTIGQTVDKIEGYAPDLVGITVLTNFADRAKELSDVLKRRLPKVIIVLGGPHATYFYGDILKEMPNIDHVIYGEADTAISEYAQHFRERDYLQRIPGLVYRKDDGSIVINEPAPQVEDLDEIPMPAWHLYNMSLYTPLPFQRKQSPFFTMITSRGCSWGKCRFCFQSGYRSVKYRRHSPERVIEEIDILYHNYGIREIAFWDDTFIINKNWLEKYAEMLGEKQLDLSWAASGRANTMDEEMIKTVYDAGCWSMFVGVESGNQDLLEVIEKGITLDEVRKVFVAANKIGIETRAAFMLGIPGETPEKGRKTVKLALELEPTYAIFYAAYPVYGTRLYDMANVTGRFLDKSYRGMSKVTYVPDGYKDAAELERLISYAYRKFYLRPRSVMRVIRKIKSVHDVKELILAVLLYLGLSDPRDR